jgi:glutamyl/glutaminyl-tRNA synthetase
MRKFWIELSLTQKDISVPLATLISHNSTEIDPSTPRLSFIQNPVMLALNCDGIELPDSIEIPCHPLHKEMGVRNWGLLTDCGLQVYIEKEDLDIAIAGDGKIRLKDFADIEVSENKGGVVTSMPRSDERPIIHWLTEEMATSHTLLRPDEQGEQLDEIEGLLEKNSHPSGTIIQLERIGFARLEPNESEPSMARMIWTHS